MKRLFCVLLALLMLCFTFVPTIAEDKQVNSKLSWLCGTSDRGNWPSYGVRASRTPETAPCRLPCQLSFKNCLVGASLALETMPKR